MKLVANGPVEPVDPRKIDDFLTGLEAEEAVEDIRPKVPEIGEVLNYKGSVYKVIASRPNGKITLKFCGVTK
jgi:hypothetical protein